MKYELRKWRLSDAKELAAALNSKRILNNLRDGLPFPYTEQDAAAYITAMRSADENDTFAYAITAENHVIGSIGAFRQGNIPPISHPRQVPDSNGKPWLATKPTRASQ